MKFTKRILAICLAMLLTMGLFTIAASASMDPVGSHTIGDVDAYRYSLLSHGKLETLMNYYDDEGIHPSILIDTEGYRGNNWDYLRLKCAGFSCCYNGGLAMPNVLPTAQGLIAAWNQFLPGIFGPAELTQYRMDRQVYVDWANAEYALRKYWLETEQITLECGSNEDTLYWLTIPDRSGNFDKYGNPSTMMTALRDVTEDIHAYLQGEGVEDSIPTDDPTEPAITLSHTASGINGTITITEPYSGVFPAGSSLTVDIFHGDTEIDSSWTNLAAYNIMLMVGGTEYHNQLPDKVLVRLPLPANITASQLSNLAVYHFENGVWVRMTILNVTDSYIEFETDSFSPFVIGLKNAENTEPPQKWWEKCSGWLRWLLRWICFGWLWMK